MRLYKWQTTKACLTCKLLSSGVRCTPRKKKENRFAVHFYGLRRALSGGECYVLAYSCIWPIDPNVVLSRGEICGLIRTTIIWFNNVCIGCLELSDSAGSLVRREKPNDVKFTRERRERSLRSIFDRWPLPKCTQTCGPCGQEQERKTPNT
jgi:hypothetical protein